MERCKWPRLEKSEIYINYHDNEWGVPSYDDNHLFEMLILESFHCGLSWLIILKKREYFRLAFDNFDPKIIANYNESKIDDLMNNSDIVRNKLKILASIQNAKSFLKTVREFGSFSNYIWSFTNRQIIYGDFDEKISKNKLSDAVSKDLKSRGFKFMGTVTCYSYLEAIGIMNNHSKKCFKYRKLKL